MFIYSPVKALINKKIDIYECKIIIDAQTNSVLISSIAVI